MTCGLVSARPVRVSACRVQVSGGLGYVAAAPRPISAAPGRGSTPLIADISRLRAHVRRPLRRYQRPRRTWQTPVRRFRRGRGTCRMTCALVSAGSVHPPTTCGQMGRRRERLPGSQGCSRTDGSDALTVSKSKTGLHVNRQALPLPSGRHPRLKLYQVSARTSQLRHATPQAGLGAQDDHTFGDPAAFRSTAPFSVRPPASMNS